MQALKKAVEAGVEAASEPTPKERRYRVAGKVVKCSHCGGELFEWGSAFVQVVGGLALECVKCSHVESFGRGELVDAVESAAS
ncbi:MAG: hypothetical protein ACXW3L_07210 [Limisphaerales bacterium]